MKPDNPQQKIIDNIKSVDTVLVTVSTNPSVDELAAALGLSLFINDLDKRSTAVVSGNLPPAINFLEPEKIFENSVDSLRDFVIALDKEKADHLRYKVDGDVVKIFITPYKTIITSDDLDYSQGDYNVEMVIALGVKDKEHLDKALESHGRILHDAIVATIGLEPSQLGTVDYNDASVSSMSELVANIVNTVANSKDKDGDSEVKISEQVASALLTGIVAATDRFSNSRTSAQVMSVAAKLMAAGANQQLIASKLREGSKMPMVDNQVSERIQKNEGEKTGRKRRSKNRGLSVNHSDDKRPAVEPPKAAEANFAEQSQSAPEVQPAQEQSEPAVEQPLESAAQTLEKVLTENPKEARAAQEMLPPSALETNQPQPDNGQISAEQLLDSALEESSNLAGAATPTEVVPNLAEELAKEASTEVVASDSSQEELNQQVQSQAEQKISEVATPAAPDDKPSFGGVLNATTEQAAEDKRRLEQADRNRTLLSHERASGGEIEGLGSSPINGAGVKEDQKMFNPMEEPSEQPPEPSLPVVDLPSANPSSMPPMQTLAEIDELNRQTPPALDLPEPIGDIAPPPADEPPADFNQQSSALDAVHAAFEMQPPMTPEPITTPAIEAVRGGQAGYVDQFEPLETAPTPPAVDLSGGIPTPPPPPTPESPLMPPAVDDFNQLPTPPALPMTPDFSAQQPLPPMQPMQDPNPLQAPMPPTLPPENLENILPTENNLPPTPPSNDPGQFKIPGQ